MPGRLSNTALIRTYEHCNKLSSYIGEGGDRSLLQFIDVIQKYNLWDKLVCWPLIQGQNIGSGNTAYALGGLGAQSGISPYDGTMVSTMTWTSSGLESSHINPGYLKVTTGAGLLSAGQVTSGAVYVRHSDGIAENPTLDFYFLYGNDVNSTSSPQYGGNFQQSSTYALINGMKGSFLNNSLREISDCYLALQENSLSAINEQEGYDYNFYVTCEVDDYLIGKDNSWIVNQQAREGIYINLAEPSFRAEDFRFFTNTTTEDPSNNSKTYLNGTLRTTKTVPTYRNAGPTNLTPNNDSYQIGKITIDPTAFPLRSVDEGTISLHYVIRDNAITENQIGKLYDTYIQTAGKTLNLPPRADMIAFDGTVINDFYTDEILTF